MDSFFFGAAFGAFMVVVAAVLVAIIDSFIVKQKDGDENG